MARKFRIFFLFSTLFLLISQTAFAKDGLFGVGARFAWENYKTPVLIQSSTTDPGVDVSGLNKTNFGGDLKIKPIDRLAISLALDLGYRKYSVLPYVSGEERTVSATYLSFGFLLGVKFYVIEPMPKKATLYLELSGGKYIAKATNNASSQDIVLDAQLRMLGDLSAPMVVQFAVGAEFFAAKSFSVGADILGLRMAYSSGSNGASADAGIWSGDQKLMTFSIYSALTLNFGFYKGEGAAKESDGAAEDGWGGSGGGAAASTDDDWGGSGGGAAAPADNGWGGDASASGGAAADSSDGWGAAPADGAEADGGWAAQPPPPDDENPVKPNKGGGKGKAKSGGGGAKSGGGGDSPPPPPPPGY